MIRRKILKFTPARIIFTSIIITICAGTALLSLPIARTTSIPFLDIFFTATSVTCVTGLLTVPLSSFSFFGQVIILFLMQIGGLGLITLTLFLMSLFVEFGFGTQLIAGQLLELESWKNIKKIISFIIGFTLIIEGIGACIIFYAIRHDYLLHRAVFLSIFHSVAAFCDTGISLFPGNMLEFATNYTILIISSILMITGGLGFITWHEILLYFQNHTRKKRFHISLHSKIVLLSTLFLIGATTLLFWIIEYHNTLESFSFTTSGLNALFNAISSRSAGFLTVPIHELQTATLFLIMLVAFIGSSPGSTGSGIKTTTFTVILATIYAAIQEKSSVSIRGRTIARDQVYKAIAVIGLSLTWIILIVFFLLITEKNWSFLDVVFETISAFATLGMSTGNSASLTPTGKLFIIATMIAGRIGAFTVVLMFHKKTDTIEFSYPEERVMLS